MEQHGCFINKTNFHRIFACCTACQLCVEGEQEGNCDKKSAIKNRKDLGCANFTAQQEKRTVLVKIVT